MKSVKKEKLEFIMPFEAKKYDNAPAELIEAFKNVDVENLTDITLGGNSYDSESCKWIKENVLMKAPYLTKVNFSNMFVSRLRADLPTSIRFLMEGLQIKNVEWVDLSDNAIGPEIKVIEKQLSEANSLKHINLSNTGLGPEGSTIFADAILKNNKMKLTEILITRSRLRDVGFENIGKIVRKQKSIQKLHLFQNVAKKGFKPLLEALKEAKDTLTELRINDNRSINRAVPELVEMIKACKNLKHLTLSDLCMKKKNCQAVSDALIESMKSGSKLEELIWS